MDNAAIADQLDLLSKLMDIHGENSFKAKSYGSAAFAIEKLPKELASLPKEKIFEQKGIGESVGKKIIELIESGEIAALKALISKTPEGVLEMMNIKGLGPKKINVLWKELGISSIDELREACKENKIAAQKGFGEKTQEKILASIEFKEQTSGSYLYAQVESFVEAFRQKLVEEFESEKIEVTGTFRRQLEVIEKLEWVTTIPKQKLKKFLSDSGLNILSESNDILVADADETITMAFHVSTEDEFYNRLFTTSCSEEFLTAVENANRLG